MQKRYRFKQLSKPLSALLVLSIANLGNTAEQPYYAYEAKEPDVMEDPSAKRELEGQEDRFEISIVEPRQLTDPSLFEQITLGKSEPMELPSPWAKAPEAPVNADVSAKSQDIITGPVELPYAATSWENHPGEFSTDTHADFQLFPRRGILAGVQGTFLAPIDDGLQSVTFTDLPNNQSYTQDTDTGFGGGVRTWLGLQSGNSGFLATYWGLENVAYEDSPLFITKDEHGFTQDYRLLANTLDLEFFQRFCLPRGTIQASLGVRHARLQRLSTVVGNGEVGGVSMDSYARGASELEGWGGTAGIGADVPLKGWFACDPGCPSSWAFFCHLQGAMIYADTKVQAITQAFALPPASGSGMSGVAYSRDEATGVWDGAVGQGSLQLGLNYGRRLGFFHRNCSMKLHSGFEGQIWQTGKVSAESQSNAFLAGQLQGNTFGGKGEAYSLVNPDDLALVGFFIGADFCF